MGGLGPKRDLATLQAQDWQGKAQAAASALSATQAQLKTLQDTIDRNAGIIKGLNDENTKIASDRDANLELARRLLNASKAIPTGPTVPAATGGQPVVSTSPASSDGSLADDIASVAQECEHNANQLNALIAEVLPQLGP